MTDSPPAGFFDELIDRFEDASRRSSGVVERCFRIAGHGIKLRFAGDALVHATCRALEHLETPLDSPASLTVNLWDSFSTGVRMVPRPWGIEAFGPLGVINGYCTLEYQTVYDHNVGALVMVDHERQRACVWVRNASELPDTEKASPLRTLVHLWLLPGNASLLHAGAVGYPEGGVLLVGAGGSGKSTTAISCMMRGMKFLADDFCVVRASPQAEAFGLYSTGKLDQPALNRIPELAGRETNPRRAPEEKAILFLNEIMPECIIDRLPVRAILIPRVTPGRSSILSAMTPSAITSMAGPSTIFMLPRAGPETLRIFAAMARSRPCYRFEVGSDTAGIAGVLEELLENLRAP